MHVIETLPVILGKHSHPIQTVKPSRDGKWLLTGDTERQIKLWRDGLLAYELDAKTPNAKASTMDRIRSVVFSSDSSQFLVASGHVLRSFRTEDCLPLWHCNFPRFLGLLMTAPLSVDASTNGRFAIAADNGTFGIRDSYGRKLRHWKHNSAPRWIRFINQDNHLIGSDSFSIRLWDCGTGETVAGFESDERTYNLEVSHATPIFATRTLHAIHVYCLDSPKPTCVMPVGPGLPLLSFSPSGEFLAGSTEHGIAIWNVGAVGSERIDPDPIATISLPDETVLSLAFDATGSSILAGCSDGRLRQFSL